MHKIQKCLVEINNHSAIIFILETIMDFLDSPSMSPSLLLLYLHNKNSYKGIVTSLVIFFSKFQKQNKKLVSFLIITSNSASGFQTTRSASIPGLSDPLRSSSLLRMAGFLHSSCTRSWKEKPLDFADVQKRGRPVCGFQSQLEDKNIVKKPGTFKQKIIWCCKIPRATMMKSFLLFSYFEQHYYLIFKTVP